MGSGQKVFGIYRRIFIEPARTPVTSVVFAGILGALYFQELHAKMVAGGHYLLK